MRPAAHAELLGNASLLTATNGKTGVELKLCGDSVRVMHATRSGNATMTIQGYHDQGYRDQGYSQPGRW